MIDAKEVQRMARSQARDSATAGLRPFVPWPEDFDVEAPDKLCASIPYLGARPHIRAAYGTRWWRRTSVQDYIEYPYDWFFVDSSGMGTPSEAALTPAQFVEMALAFATAAHARGEEVGFGIAEVGQSQVHIAPYVRRV